MDTTLLIAIYGALQVPAIALYRRFIYPGKLEIYPTNEIEIGYSGFGPQVGIYGTLLAMNRDVFISNVSVLIQRSKDEAQYRFNWLAFRSPQMALGVGSQVTLELATGFMISTSQPHRFSMILSDRQRLLEMSPVMGQIRREWSQQIKSAGVPNPDYSFLFGEFVKQGRALDPWKSLERFCYWEAGAYSAEITVQSLHPKKQFSIRRTFLLTEDNAEALRQNAFLILAQICNQPNVVFQFSYPVLQA